MSTLAKIISTAFADVPRPIGPRAIAPHACYECDDLAKEFSPYDFRSLPGPVIEAQYSSLPLLSPAALHHYLPGYMLHALRCDPGSLFLNLIVYHLVPSKESVAKTPAYFRDRFAVFSEAQRSAIGAFLSHVYSSGQMIGSEPRVERARALWPNVV